MAGYVRDGYLKPTIGTLIDRRRVAAIALESGGTIGIVGWLVYDVSHPSRNIGFVSGGTVVFKGGRLVTTTGVWSNRSPNCCPRQELVRFWRPTSVGFAVYRMYLQRSRDATRDLGNR